MGCEVGRRTQDLTPSLEEMVGWMMSRAEVGANGKTGYERCKGKVARMPGMEFGEAIFVERRRE